METIDYETILKQAGLGHEYGAGMGIMKMAVREAIRITLKEASEKAMIKSIKGNDCWAEFVDPQSIIGLEEQLIQELTK